MKVIISALCLCLLLAVASANPLAESCGQVCQQSCDIIKQVFAVFSVFLGPFVNTGHALCSQSCNFVCGIFG